MNKIVWQLSFTRPGSLLKNSTLLRGLDLTFFKYIGKPAQLLIHQDKGGTCAWYVDQDEWRLFEREVVKGAKSLSSLFDFSKESQEICSRYVKTTKKLDSDDLTNKTNQELKGLLEIVHQAADDLAFLIWIFWPLDPYLENLLWKKLKIVLGKKGKEEDVQQYFMILTNKTGLIAADTEEIELLKIKTKINQGGLTPEIDNLIDRHSLKYAWLPVYDFNLEPWDKSHFKQSLEKLPDSPEEELKKRRKHLLKSKRMIRKILKELRNQELSNLVKIIQEFLVLRTERTDALRKGYYNLKPFIRELARRLNWDEKEVPSLTVDEIYAFLDGQIIPTRQEIKERQKGAIILKKKDCKIVSDETKMKKILRGELGRTRKEVRVLRGNAAYQGRTKGLVKIINKVSDIGKMEQGDVLVSRMTFPDLLMAIKRAGAIVTDEGGITCHAAIISREFSIPCVVGTQIATKVLKDEDLVEVDAGKGIIKKI